MLMRLSMVLLLAALPVMAQERFDLKNASRQFDVRIEVASCENKICEGMATYTLFIKGTAKRFQIFKLANTSFLLDESNKPPANRTLLYDQQSAINFGDFNFDGTEDLALCDGTKGGYGMPSYQIYLFSRQSKKFVNSTAFTRLAQQGYLGMFEVDEKRKVLQTFSKSGCCFHVTEEYTVVENRPKKVLEITEDATNFESQKVKITTLRLVKGRWRKTVRFETRREN